ncbi:MAG: tetratricopeptide repeat protein [Verrucomicrobia bacterium]|nr:tetratricopeptide repeat protein [Verrucomicrobiota bacterium]
MAVSTPAVFGQDLGGGSGLSPEVEAELDYADRLMAAGMADYSEAIFKTLSLPPEIKDIREIRNACAQGKFPEAEKIVAKRGGETQEAWTLKLSLADGYYMWGKYAEAQKIYDGFFAKFPDGPKPALKGFYLESAYKYSQMMLMMDNKPAAAKAYRAAVKAKPERHIDRQLKSELCEVLLQLAEEADAKARPALLAEIKKYVDEILWVQDLWFGRAIVMLAHMQKMQNNIDGAMSLIDDYTSQLKDIDKALKQSADETGEDMTKLSPMAQCRYMIGVIMHDEAKKIVKEGGDRQRALDLLIGKVTGRTSRGKDKRSSGSLQHFLNVFIRYPNTSWAPDCGNRFREVEEMLKEVWDKEVKAKITPAQWNAVELAQFREARSLFKQQRFKEASEAYEQVLALFPERENSVAAMGELAACYIELEEHLSCDVLLRHVAERFCRNKELMVAAGDQLVRVAFKFSERNDEARMREAYDVFFTYMTQHPRAASELFRFAQEEFRGNNLDKAMSYYEQIVANHEGKPVYFDALSQIAFVHSKQERPGDEVKTLKLLIEKLKAQENPGHAVVSAMFRFANALKALGPKYLPLAISKYSDLEKMLLDKEARLAYQNSAEEAESNARILQASLFYRAMADCMRTVVPKNVSDYFAKKYKRKVPDALILKTYYKAGAIKTLLTLVDSFPKSDFSPLALSQIGTLYTVLEKPDDARKALQRLQKEYPESEQAKNAVFMIGLNLLEMGMEREAIGYFKEMFSGKGEYAAGQILTAGKALYDAKQYAVALQAFDRIIKSETERGYVEPARVRKGQSLLALKKFKEAADVLRGVLADYPSSGYTIEICLGASQAFAAVASETADAESRRAIFDEGVVAMKRARKFAKAAGKKTELDVGVARIFERKSAAETQFGDAAKAEQYRNDAVAAYQAVIMFQNPDDETVAPHLEDAYFYCLPLLLEMERWDDALQDADRYIKDFPKGKHTLKVRQYQSKARVSGGTKAAPSAAPAPATTPEEG